MIFCNAGKSRAVPWTELKRENPPGTWPPNGAMTAGPSATDALWVGECCVGSSYLTSQMGQGRSSGDVRVTSGLALNPDITTAPGGGGGGRGGRGGGGRGGPGGLGTSL